MFFSSAGVTSAAVGTERASMPIRSTFGPLRTSTDRWYMSLMRRLLLGFWIAVSPHWPAGIASADDRHSFYRMLLSIERSALEAVRKHSVDELLTIHNDAMSFAASDGRRLWKPEPICVNAYIQLSVAVLAYASAIEPTRSQPVRSASENAAWGDEIWTQYLNEITDCEKSIGIESPANRTPRPSALLSKLLPTLPDQKSRS